MGNTFQTRPFTNTTTKMSFSNADTGSKNADPYKATNKDETSIQEKVEDLSEFVKACKFGMMTTRDGSSGALVSRCMALAAQETGGIDLIFHTNTESGKTNDIDSDSHITGKAPAVNKLREISEQEVSTWRSSNKMVN